MRYAIGANHRRVDSAVPHALCQGALHKLLLAGPGCVCMRLPIGIDECHSHSLPRRNVARVSIGCWIRQLSLLVRNSRRRPSSSSPVVRRRSRRRRLPTLQRHTTRPLSKHAPVVTALVEGLCDLATEEAISHLQVMRQSCSVPIDDI